MIISMSSFRPPTLRAPLALLLLCSRGGAHALCALAAQERVISHALLRWHRGVVPPPLTVTFAAADVEDGERRLGQVAARAFAADLGSKSQAVNALKRGDLRLNGEARVEACRHLRDGDQLTLTRATPLPLEGSALKAAVNFAGHLKEQGLVALYEDDDVAVCHKPAGVHTKRRTNRKYLSFEDACCAVLTPSAAADALPLPLAAHRLDVRVCGLTLVAKSRTAMRELERSFRERRVQKTYRALVIGAPPEGCEEVATPVDGLPARTGMRVLSVVAHEHWGALGHVELQPHTGRTHQLRVHMASLGTPIVGDDLYHDMMV